MLLRLEHLLAIGLCFVHVYKHLSGFEPTHVSVYIYLRMYSQISHIQTSNIPQPRYAVEITLIKHTLLVK